MAYQSYNSEFILNSFIVIVIGKTSEVKKANTVSIINKLFQRKYNHKS